MDSVIWACPDCGADLTDGWCARCEMPWSWPELAADYQHPEDDDD